MKFFISIVSTLLFAFSVFAQNQAEVIVTSTYLRKLPETGSGKVQTVQKGEKVTFEKSQDKNGWSFVSILNGKVKGWIRKDTIGSIVKLRAAEQKPPKKAVSTATPIATETPIKIIVPNPKPAINSSSASSAATVEDEEVLRVETEEISLNVRVVNNSNRPVNNLNQSDFNIYEDNVLQPITFFTTAEIPIINALVIDNSRSLRSQLAEVIVAGKIIVSANRPKDESTIVRFVSKDKIEVVQDFTSNKNSLNEALNNLFVEGGQTAIIDAVYQTAKKVEHYQNSTKKEDVKLRSIILVSDGDDRGSSYKEQQLFELLREFHIQIYAIGFVNDLSKEPELSGTSRQNKARTFLTRLAKETGGKVYFPDSINELPKIASDISGELRTQYLISYNPTNTTRGGNFREIKVVVAEGTNKEKRTAITRTGRNAPTN
jgi:Ca-activated chloride channel family protein